MPAGEKPEQLYTIAQLEHITGVPRRTIYFYVKEGLLPAPGGRGPSARYTDTHRLRLALVDLLKSSTHLRLQGIREYIQPLTDEELRAEIEQLGGSVDSGQDAEAAVLRFSPDSHEYGELARERVKDGTIKSAGSTSEDFRELLAEVRDLESGRENNAPRFALPEMRRRLAGITRKSSRRASDAECEETVWQDTWHRVRITDDLEIHYRGGADRGITRKIRKLIAKAWKLFHD
jgi:DNA-binding transcriptional MerR regulator